MLAIQNVSYAYTKGKSILKNINFNVKQGEYVALLGESGCGKSTLLEIIYGLMDLKEGTIFYGDKKLLGPKFNIIPGHPFMKYLAQDFSLMPFTTAAENVGEFLSNIYKEKKQARVKELLEVVDMSDFANTKVKNLSGGQKQRVAIARVLAKEPKILLLDEPFSHIDNFRKNNLRRRLFTYLKAQKISCIVATHDSTDALSFADTIHIIRNTNIIASGTPKEIYETPNSVYVASFFNEVNEIPYKLLNIQKKGTAVLYPEQLKIVEKSDLKATVLNSYFKGSFYLIEVKFHQQQIIIASHKEHTKGTLLNISL
ncbi:ABC-type Fe3+/spermidine/putrescine transport system ATPase subunit [Wenyingzhuangia heitensis]|uniref:ABC-type Fe3+/spermidine/putrescine transport system ATPase subunit n=1 Tax=Wenyingzhuangia heitensis TaxID=1487859 RepID=A0ABX0U6P1_9FLAO|nr:ABC transporter ATP-binding protein [Wenyingzhuangia heitensis]NIJ44019.1 ABC-type Fe3+/spermidine/putrescine transport system ATPase subunit [Wenyingzhuangia heitensis]